LPTLLSYKDHSGIQFHTNRLAKYFDENVNYSLERYRWRVP
jgi:hypothetical protein